MNKAGKAWGQTQLLESNGSIELHRIIFNKDKKCSFHVHNTKFNGFYIIDGHLEISVKKNDYDLTDVTYLGPGDYMKVAPGEYHQFRGLTDGVALEIYWSEFNPNDIVRATSGG